MEDSRQSIVSRRSFVAATTSGLTVLAAGCLGGDSPDESTETPDAEGSPEDTQTSTGTPDEPIVVPNTQLAFNYFASTHLVDIDHDGGDDITAENTGELEVTGDATAGPVVIDENSDAPYSVGDELFADIRILSGDVIEVQWTSNDGSKTEVLGTFKAP